MSKYNNKKIYILALIIFTIFSLAGCSYHPKIEKFNWEFQIAYSYSEENYGSKDPFFLAVGEKYKDEWSYAPIKNIVIDIKNDTISIHDIDSNKIYSGSYRMNENPDKNNNTTYYSEIEGQDVKGGNLIGEWQVQYKNEKDQWYDVNNAPYHILIGEFNRVESTFDDLGNEIMMKFTYIFQFISFDEV